MGSEGTGWSSHILGILQQLMVLGAIVFTAPMAYAGDYQVAQQPGWVTPRTLDLSTQPTSGQAVDGVFYQLVDQQTQILPTGRTTFRRVAVQALNGRGLESASHINVGFDPTYQSFTLHALNVHRDGRVQDRLHTTHIGVLQRESDLEYRMYDGSRTVDIVLSDIRPGDVVEYSYSVRGTNPALVGKESGRLDMQWSVAVHHLYRRLITPAGLDLWFRSHLGDFQPQVSRRGVWTEYNWSATDTAPLTRERDTPRWYDAYPNVEWTSFKDWAAVAHWAEPMYAIPKDLGAPLRQEIDRIAASHASPESRLAAVLAFVQSQIRYLGIEIGQGSYQPRMPQKVFQNRYGDCKDKVLLAVAMLRAMNIEAFPALVNTTRRHTVADALPSPNAFNHVIFKASVAGTDYWLDPTRSPQKGQLQRLAQANFGSALVIDGQANSLTSMPRTQASEYRRAIDIRVDASNGYDQPSTMTVSTVYDGASADDMRDTVHNSDLVELQRKYHNFYLRSYPNMTVLKPLTVADDEGENRLVTVEYYLVPTLVSRGAKDARPAAYLYAPDMKAMLYRPDDTVRVAPYALKHPEDLTVTMTVNLPFDPAIAGSHTVVDDPAFKFEGTTSFDARKLSLSYHYRSLADHVLPEKMEAFIANLQQARNAVGYGLWANKPKTSGWSKKDSFAFTAILLGMILFIQTAIAVAFVGFDVWSSRNAVRQRSIRTLLFTGISLFWAPAIAMLLWFAMVVVVLKQLNDPVEKVLPLIFFVAAILSGLFLLWRAFWRNRWLRWALARAPERLTFESWAKRFRLPYQLPSIAPMIWHVSWLAYSPHFLLLALLVSIARLVEFGDPFAIGLFSYVVVATGIGMLGQQSHRRGLKLMKQMRFAEAIQEFESSNAFFARNLWVDRWRAFTVLSVSRASFREMALTNIAFCFHQIGRDIDAIRYYELTLAQFPGSAIAGTELGKLRAKLIV